MTDLVFSPWFFIFWLFIFLLGALEVINAPPKAAGSRRIRWPANIGLGLINGVIVSAIPVGAVAAAYWAQGSAIGLMNVISVPLWVLIVTTVLVRSLAQYVFHRTMHQVPWLWHIHKVNHSDDHMDGSTGLRFHPLEALAALVFTAMVGVIFGVDPEILAIVELIEILYGIATHTALRVPSWLDRLMRSVLITPDLHRVHHAADAAMYDKNFGAVLSIWDRFFGTYLTTADAHAVPLGIGDKDERTRGDIGWLLILPFRR